ncbi:MAG: hypothetical protein IIB02_08980, partial [Thaumarchaeota archaeon]|nr:hypothetical protein [Nitrososphaerota archaeon]
KSNQDVYPFQGKIEGGDISVILALDNAQVATLSGVTQYGQWMGEYYFKENISAPGEYAVDVIASYLGKTVSNTSAMFVIGTVPSGGSGNNAPIANAGSDTPLTHPNTLLLDGSGSSDPDGDTLTYSWVIQSGLGSLSNENTVAPTYTTAGATTAIIVLTVTDDTGKSSTDTVTITVT